MPFDNGRIRRPRAWPAALGTRGLADTIPDLYYYKYNNVISFSRGGRDKRITNSKILFTHRNRVPACPHVPPLVLLLVASFFLVPSSFHSHRLVRSSPEALRGDGEVTHRGTQLSHCVPHHSRPFYCKFKLKPIGAGLFGWAWHIEPR